MHRCGHWKPIDQLKIDASTLRSGVPTPTIKLTNAAENNEFPKKSDGHRCYLKDNILGIAGPPKCRLADESLPGESSSGYSEDLQACAAQKSTDHTQSQKRNDEAWISEPALTG